MKRKYQIAYVIFHNFPGLIGWGRIGPVCITKEIANDEIKKLKKKKMFKDRHFYVNTCRIRIA